jgi:aspartate aminotransferase
MPSATSSTIRLSDRVRRLKPSGTLAVTAKVKAMRAAGEDIIGFGAGEPDFDTPDHIKDVAIEAMRAGNTKYQPVIGDPAARAAIAGKLRDENGIECAADDICISVGGKHALYLALQCLLDPAPETGSASEVIILTPAWLSYRPMIEVAGGRVVEVATSTANGFKAAPDDLAAAITPRTRAIILNSPSNPCGTMYAPDEIRALADVLAAHEHVTVVSDEIYEKLVYGDAAHLSPASIESIADRTVTINALSKAYAMTGWRIGYGCGRGGFAKAMAALQSQMTSCIVSFCYPAIVEALANGAPDVEKMRRVFAERAGVMHDLISAMPGVVCPRPEGAFYAFPDVSAYFGRTTAGGRAIDSALTFAAALLEEARVAVVPGEDFGACAKGHVRLSFACSTDEIREGCRRISSFLSAMR